MTPVERQKLLRLLVKQITVGKDLITVHHSIPTGATRGSAELTSYPLCTRGHLPLLANWTLDGLEATVKGLFGWRPKVHVRG